MLKIIESSTHLIHLGHQLKHLPQPTTAQKAVDIGNSAVLCLRVVPHLSPQTADALVTVSASQCYAVHRLATSVEVPEKGPVEDQKGYVGAQSCKCV